MRTALSSPPTSGVKLWLRADSASVTRDSNNKVSRWQDLSGLGNDVTATGSNQPTFTSSSINGFPAITFAGSQVLSTENAVLASGSDRSIIAVVKATANHGGIIYGCRSSYPGFFIDAADSPAAFPNQFLVYSDAIGTASETGATYHFDGTGKVFEFYSHVGNTLGVDINGVPAPVAPALGNGHNTVTTDSGGSNTSYVGNYFGGDGAFAGDIAELLIYDHQLGASEIATVRAYLQTRYQISLPPPLPANGLKLWVNGDESGVVKDGANNVSKWLDRSGNGNDVSASGASRPTFSGSSINGLPAITFAGSQVLSTTNAVVASGSPRSIIAVVKAAANQGGIIFGSRSAYPGYFIDAASVAGNFIVYSDAIGSASVTSPAFNFNGSAAEFEFSSQVNSPIGVSINGVATAVAPWGNNSNSVSLDSGGSSATYVGNYFGGDGVFHGDIAELLVYDHQLSGSDTTAVRAYLQSRYGLALALSAPVADCVGKAEDDPCDHGTSCPSNNVCHNGICGGPPTTTGFVCDGAYPIGYHLDEDGYVSLNIYDTNGKTIRELLHATPQSAGDHTIAWDGLDRNGVPRHGDFTWKLLRTPGGLTAQYQYKVGDNYPVGDDSSSSGGPGSHNAPYAVAYDGSATYIAANGTENFESTLVKLQPDVNGDPVNGGTRRAWSQSAVGQLPDGSPSLVHPLPYDGARALAVDRGKTYMLSRESPQKISINVAATGALLVSQDFPDDPITIAVDWEATDADWRVSGTADDVELGATDMDVAGGVAVVAYRNQHALRWYCTIDKDIGCTNGEYQAPMSANFDPRGVAVASDGTVFVTSGGTQVLAFAPNTHDSPTTLPISGLIGATRLDVASNGDLLIYDLGGTTPETRVAQVKRYTRSQTQGGQIVWSLARTYGTAGGRQTGPYHATDLDEVTDVTADDIGGFFVAEPYSAPRRVAHFAADGTKIAEWFGGQPYYPHAAFDPTDVHKMWVVSAYSHDGSDRTLMEIKADLEHKTWNVLSTFKYLSSTGNPLMHDSGNEGGLFRITTVGGYKYLSIEGAPVIYRIIEANEPNDDAATELRPATAFGWYNDSIHPPGSGYQWNDDVGPGDTEPDGLVEDGETHDFTATAGTVFAVSHVDAKLDWYFADSSTWQVDRWSVNSFTAGHAPVYDTEPLLGYAPGTDRFQSFGYSPAWGAFIFHDVPSDNLYVAANPGATGLPFTSTDSFVQNWSHGQAKWDVGQLGPASRSPYVSNLRPVATNPGDIYQTVRGLSGVAHGCIIATDFRGEYDDPYDIPAYTYVWDQDGLFVGGIFDHPDLNGIPWFMYAGGSEGAHSSVLTLANGDVYFANAWFNDVRVYKVTGWDGDESAWERQSGPIHIDELGTADGVGLTGTYYDNTDFTDARTVRVDGPIDDTTTTNWGTGVPAGTALTDPSDFTVRWTGAIRPDYGPKYTGYWAHVADDNASNGGYHQAYNNDGSTVEFAFKGTKVSIVALKQPNGYLANVYLDNDPAPVGPIDMSSPTPAQATIYESRTMPLGDHKVIVQVVPAAYPVEKGRTIAIDHFVVDGVSLAGEPPVSVTVDDAGLPYQLYTRSEGGTQLWLQNQSLIYDWKKQDAVITELGSSSPPLERTDYPIEVDLLKVGAGPLSMALEWSSAMEAKTIVPRRALVPFADPKVVDRVADAKWVGKDTGTQGNWLNVYGREAHNVGRFWPLFLSGDSGSHPYFTDGVDDNPKYLQVPSGSGRFNPAFGCDGQPPRPAYPCVAPDGITYFINYDDGQWHKMSVYSMYPGEDAPLTYSVTDANGVQLNQQANVTGINNGVWESWNVRGHVILKVTLDAYTGSEGTPLVQGLFFDPATVSMAMSVSSNGHVISDGSLTPDVAHGTDMGSQSLGGGGHQQTFTIQSGSMPVLFGGTPPVQISGPQASEFTVTPQPASSLVAGAAASFTVTFTPAALGVRRAHVTIANDTVESPYDFEIRGTGVP